MPSATDVCPPKTSGVTTRIYREWEVIDVPHHMADSAPRGTVLLRDVTGWTVAFFFSRQVAEEIAERHNEFLNV